MRIIFATDIHHAFRGVERLLDETSADLYLICGDLVSRAFPSYKKAWDFMEACDCAFIKNGDGSAREEARERCSRLSREAESYLKRSYERLEGIFSRRPLKRIRVLPGNYDMDLSLTALRERDFHNRCIKEDGLKIAGYGGAEVLTPGTPAHLQVTYDSKELSSLLSAHRPDILVVHQPPHGRLDCLSSFGNTGSQALRGYLDDSGPVVVLSGHNHESWGFLRCGNSIHINPSNFGAAAAPSGLRAGGYFLDLCLVNGALERATIRRLEKGGIFAIAEWEILPQGTNKIILDEPRYRKMGGAIPRLTHIHPIRQLRRIRDFFLKYQTAKTSELVSKLRDVYRDIKMKGMEVGFDLLGSVSFGMAGDNSDLDLVVYMRSRDCVLDELDTCGVPRPLRAVFDALKERGIETEVCDSIDLDRVTEAISREDLEDGQLQRFLFYRSVCRPVNLRLIKKAENNLLEREAFKRRLEESLRSYLDVLVSSVRHVRSFDKYRERLHERGIRIPPDIEEAIGHWLQRPARQRND
jgi:Icc-related predicted phosphoesterase